MSKPKIKPQQLIEEAIEGFRASLAALQAERVAQLDRVLDDPEGASDRVGQIDSDIVALQTRIRTLEDAREQRDRAEQAARSAERIEAARARRDNVLANATARAAAGGLADQIDTAFAQVLDLVTQYVELGRQIDVDLRETLTTMHRGADSIRLHDTIALVGGAARGHGAEAAFAIHSFVGELLKRLGGSDVEQLVQLNRFTRRGINTMQGAARHDLQALQDRLHLPPPPKPTADGVTLLAAYGTQAVPTTGKLSRDDWQKALEPAPDTNMIRPLPEQGLQRAEYGDASVKTWHKAIGGSAA